MKFPRFMKRLLLLMAATLALQVGAWAQPSLIFEPVAPEPGEQFCIDVTVKDVTDILSMDFSLEWDASVLDFERVEGFGLPNLDGTNFDAALAGEGKLGVSWFFANCAPSVPGLTIADGTVIFRLCFRAIGGYGAVSQIRISSDPRPINVQRVNACPTNIGMKGVGGLISVGVRPLTLVASQETANEGDLVCVDFSVRGFDNLTSMQFSVNWDPEVLRFEDVIVLENLVNLARSSFGTPANPAVGAGNLTMSWEYTVGGGISLADETVIFQVCYRVIGACERTTDITFSDSPTPFEVTNNVMQGFRLFGVTEPGRVRVGSCTPTGLQLFADCGPPVNPNEEVCVRISTAGFTNIREFDWNLEWNENILEFVDIRNVTTQLSGFTQGNFNRANVSNGVLGVNWMTVLPSGLSLAGGAGDLFEVCFKVVGVGGGSPVRFSGAPARVIRTNNNIGINPSNCAVEVIRPSGVIISMADVEAPLGDNACVDIAVSNFNDITRFQFSLAWEPTHAEFTGINNVNLPGASFPANFTLLGVDNGSLSFTWAPTQPVTVPDNTVIFQACFDLVGEPQDCQELLVVNEPLVTEAVTATSNGNDIGVVAQPGETCILFPEGFFLDIADVAADTGTVACVPVSVRSFDNILSAGFTISWEPSALLFNRVEIPNTLTNLTQASFNTSSTNVGVLQINWNNATPVNIPDDAVIFELCFDLVGSPDTCYQVRVGDPTAQVNTANGEGSLLSDPGEVCIKDRLVITNRNIRAVSCPDTNDGSVVLTVSGGRQPIGITWATTPPQFGPEARNLPPGEVIVTIFDNSNPSLILRDTIEIPLSADLPFADAGEDQLFVCDPPIVPLNGQGSAGPNFSYRWTAFGGGRLTPDFTELSTGALAPGTYVLAVTNNETGCAARDTVRIIATDFPLADAGFERELICDSDGVMLGGTATAAGPNITYLWTARDGGVVPEGQETLATPMVAIAGTYILAVTNTESRCVTRDTVQVLSNQMFPNANAGEDQRLGCDEGSRVTLASTSVNSESVAFEWLDRNGEVISTSETATVDSLGTFLLKVTMLSNNCAAIDTVRVIPSEDAPVLSFGTIQELTCITDTVTINANVTNSTNFTFEWTAQQGGAFVSGTETSLTPRIATPGIYQLIVRDTSTNCTVGDTFSIRTNVELPMVDAGPADTLTCQETSVMLDGSGSATGEDFSYRWLRNGQEVAANTLTPEVNAIGTYLLEITDNRNGCVSVDSVRIEPDIDAPQVILPVEIFKLDCEVTAANITANIMPGNPNFIIEWTTAAGNIVSGQSTTAIEVDRAGTYSIKVTNPANGCESVSDAVVELEADLPTAVAGTDAELTCVDDVLTLSGNGSSVGNDFTYQWNALEGGTPPSPSNALQASVNTPGTYELVVTNTRNNCVTTDTVVVIQNIEAPQISFAAVDQLSCSIEMVTVDASATTPNAGVTAQWVGLDGGNATVGTNPLIVQIAQSGRYELIVTNDINGCVARDTVNVTTDESRPEALIALPGILTCNQPSTQLNAAGSSVTGEFTTQWSVVSGPGTVQPDPNNPLLATANGPGNYRLQITRTADGCSATAEMLVEEDTNFPMATATADQSRIGCGESTNLNSTGSSAGPEITYRWSVLSGTGSLPNPTQPSVQVSQAGMYRLVVTNTENGCADSATVSITFDIQFALANAGADQGVCEPTASLNANLPSGTTGRWASLTGATLSATTESQVSANNLQVGDNRFVWTLSAPGCESYSADTVVVKLESAPLAADDALTLKAGETTGSVLVTSNDQINNIANFNITISRNGLLGTAAAQSGGRVNYTVKPGVFGDDEFTYTICSANCPTFCDSALVQVFIEQDPNFQAPPRTNAITPNGDGVNDFLVFDELTGATEQYPDNQLIIFNRWGDIVFEARPYVNNWEGTNNLGQNLPEGTYYYILRLNISEGIIIRGDVTVLR